VEKRRSNENAGGRGRGTTDEWACLVKKKNILGNEMGEKGTRGRKALNHELKNKEGGKGGEIAGRFGTMSGNT